MIETGRICLKIAGREAGKYAVIVERLDDNFVVVTGPNTVTGVKRRKCNLDHLELTDNKFDVREKVDNTVLEEEWKKSGLIEKLEIKMPVKKTKEKKTEEK